MHKVFLSLLAIIAIMGFDTTQANESSSTAVKLNVDANATKWQISKYLNGMHFVYAVEPDALYDDERVAEWMRAAKVKIIRWPGGTAVMTYHWDNLTGDAFGPDRWSPHYVEQGISPAEYMDLDEFVAYCRRVGAEPMVGVNILSGHKYRGDVEYSYREARELIQYCVDQGYNVKHWYIGNECFAKGTPGMSYPKTIDKFALILKEVDPDITIYADWKFGPEHSHQFKKAIEHVDNSEEIDVMEIHEKWGSKWGLRTGRTFADWIAETPLYSGKMVTYSKRFYNHVDSVGRDVRLGMNEWGVQTTNAKPGDKPRTSAENALIVAEYMLDMVRANVATACYWNLNIGPKGSKILETANEGKRLTRISEIGDIFLMSAHALEEGYLEIATSDPRVRGFGAVSSSGQRLQIYLLNKFESGAVVGLDIENFNTRHSTYSMQCYTVDKFDNEPLPIEIADRANPTIALPALSFTRVVIEP